MRNLISKLGASGDVVRATVLLSELTGDVYWLTKEYNKDLLQSKRIKEVYFFENPDHRKALKEMDFDLVLGLDEEKEVLELLKEVKAERFIGHFLNPSLTSGVDYTSECNYWLDMSMVSKKYTREEADKLKLTRGKPIPQILIEMVFGEG